jgi:hypothetical protein
MVTTAASGLLQMSEYRGSEGGAAPDFGGLGHGRGCLKWWFVEINGLRYRGFEMDFESMESWVR